MAEARAGERETEAPAGLFMVFDIPVEHVISEAGLEALMAPLNLPKPARLRVIKALKGANLEYWSRKISGIGHADHAKSLLLAKSIAKRSKEVAEALRYIHPDFLAVIDADRRGIRPVSDRRAQLAAFDLAAEIEGLAAATENVLKKVTSRPNNRPEQAGLKRTVRYLVSALEKEGQSVGTSRSKNSVRHPHLTGPGGQLIARYFAQMDPQITETALYRILNPPETKATIGTDK